MESNRGVVAYLFHTLIDLEALGYRKPETAVAGLRQGEVAAVQDGEVGFNNARCRPVVTDVLEDGYSLARPLNPGNIDLRYHIPSFSRPCCACGVGHPF